MQLDNTLQDAMDLALKAKALNKYGSFITTRSAAKEELIKSSTSRSPSGTKTTLKPHAKSDVRKPHQEFTFKSRRCFKSQGLGNIASKYPNRRGVALVEEEEAEEEVVEEEVESDHDDELTMPDHGTSLVAQRSLKVGAISSEELEPFLVKRNGCGLMFVTQGAHLRAKFAW